MSEVIELPDEDGLTDDDQLELARTSPMIHFQTCVTIYNRDGDIIKPVPNILQMRMSEVYETCMALGVKCWMIVCKPRQVGCSTFGSNIGYVHGRNYRSRGLIIADKKDNSVGLLEKTAGYADTDRFPWEQRHNFGAEKGHFTNGSIYETDTAENPKAGISKTRQFMHASEIGKWPRTGTKNDKRTMAALLPSVSKGPKSLVIAESTPDGASGWMYETWQEAVTLEEFLAALERGEQPGNGWIKVFAAWFEFEEHVMPVSEEQADNIMAKLTAREKDGVKLYGWTADQIAWRRATIASECNGDEAFFDEYYPEDDKRCWLVSGRPRFSMPGVTRWEALAEASNPTRGFLGWANGEDKRSVSWSPTVDGMGDIEVWEEPRHGCRYLIGCDPATGKSQTKGADPDRSSIMVMRQGFANQHGEWIPAKVVARVKAPFYGDADEVAGHLCRLCRYYGNALIVLEVNMGLHVLELLKLEGVPVLKRTVFDEKLNSQREVLGWRLDDKNQRRIVIDTLAQAVRTQDLEVMCPNVVKEMKAFVTMDNGREEAAPGSHDDDVLCLAMMWYCLGSASEYRGKVRARRRPKDWRDWKSVGEY